MQNKLFINFILLSGIFYFLNIPEYSFSWIFQNILLLEYSRIFLFQNILLLEYSTSRIFHFQNIPLLEYSSSRIFYFQNTLYLEHSSNRMFYQRTINASRSHVDSTLLSTSDSSRIFNDLGRPPRGLDLKLLRPEYWSMVS